MKNGRREFFYHPGVEEVCFKLKTSTSYEQTDKADEVVPKDYDTYLLGLPTMNVKQKQM